MAAVTIDEQAERAKRALKAARAASAKAAKIAIDEQLNISTRRHQAQRIKAAALDDVELILAGRSESADAGAGPKGARGKTAKA